MRTTHELLEYVDRMIDVGVDKTELQSQLALIEMQSSSVKQDEISGKILAPLVVNADEPERKEGQGN
jgi:hypothetical protein